MKYIISPVTTWDEENQLFSTKVGRNTKGRPLDYNAFGKTEKESRKKADQLCKLLNFDYEANK